MFDHFSVTGTIATQPRHTVNGAGLATTSFRLASSHRRYDRATSTWVEAPTNWYSVVAFGSLARNAATSLHKGERVVVRGRLQIRDWSNGERTGTTVEVVAESLGHDLLWGTTAYARSAAAAGRSDALEVAEPTEAGAGVADAVDAAGWTLPGGLTGDLAPDVLPGELADVPF